MSSTLTIPYPEWDFAPQSSPMVAKNSLWGRVKQAQMMRQEYRTGFGKYKRIYRTIKAMQEQDRVRRLVFGDFPVQKVVRVDGRLFLDLSAPGFPSEAYQQHCQDRYNWVDPGEEQLGLKVVYLSITNKCSLKCEHCYEWHRLNRKDRLSSEDLDTIVRKLQKNGVGVFYIEGGEPLLRYNDLLNLLRSASQTSDFWIITSGYGLTREKALSLKRHGLTGVIVSLDHYREDAHNQFRGYKHAFKSATNAVMHANRARLATALSVCTTKTFVNPENLNRYMDLARRLGVGFVQLLEPIAAGRYEGRDVELSTAKKQLLESVYLQYNSQEAFKDFPIIFYPAYHQRKIGCFGSGSRYAFVDSDGYLHACPFCQERHSNILQIPVGEALNHLRKLGCHHFAEGVIDTSAVPGLIKNSVFAAV